MKKIFLHGSLGKRFGKVWSLDVDSVPEALHAIDCNKEGFLNYLLEEYDSGNNYIFLNKKISKNETEESFKEKMFCEKTYNAKLSTDEVHIVPQLVGSGFFIPAIIKIGTWIAAQGFLFKAILFAAISFGIQALFKPPAPPKHTSEQVSTRSYIMSGAQNRKSQGDPVPMGYGQLLIGSSNIGEEKVVRHQTNQTTTRGDINSLESVSEYDYLDLLCEGPVEGLVDETGAKVYKNEGESYNKNLKSVHLNNVPVVTKDGRTNFVLSEGFDEDECKFNDGSLGAQGNFVPEKSSYLIELGNKTLFGPSPQDEVNGVAYKTIYQGSASEYLDKIHFAREAGSQVFSYLVSNKNVSQVTFFMSAELQYQQQKVDGSNSHSWTSDCFVDFSVFVERGGVEYNIFSPESGCTIVKSDNDQWWHKINAQETYGRKIPRRGFSRYSEQGLSGVTGNYSYVGSSVSKAVYGLNYYFSNPSVEYDYKPVEIQRSLYEALVSNNISTNSVTQISEDEKNDYNYQTLEAIVKSYEAFVDNNPVVYQNYISEGSKDFLTLYGLASGGVEIPLTIHIDRDRFFEGESTRGVVFKFMKITHEIDPTGNTEMRASDAPLNNGTGNMHLSQIFTRANLGIQQVQETIFQEVGYPHSCFARLKVDSRNFSQSPQRSYNIKLKKVLIPENYDPNIRKYDGAWNGLFLGQDSQEININDVHESNLRWTDNPAWIFYDVISNPRFGVSKYGLTPEDIDRWQLYKIAKYCDELVATNYAPETSTNLLRPFRANISEQYNENTEELTVSLDNYIIYTDTNSNTVKVNSAHDNAINSRQFEGKGGNTVRFEDDLSSSNISDVFYHIYGRDNTLREYEIYLGDKKFKYGSTESEYNWTVGSLIDSLNSFNSGSDVAYRYDLNSFINEFGAGDQYKGKKVAFYIKKSTYKSRGDDFIRQLQTIACAQGKDCLVEERVLVRSIPESRQIVVQGGNFDSSSSISFIPNEGVGYDMVVGGCSLQKSYPIVEPRFTCNIYITEQIEAINMLNSIASCFRSVIAYNNGKISLSQDHPRLPVKIFNNTNVLEGGFSYSGEEKKMKYTSCMVRFNNKEKKFAPDVIYEEDVQGIQRLGFREKEIIGFGITSESQARRLAKWILLTSRLESEGVSFSCGIEGNSIAPGLVFQVVDNMRSSRQISGRVLGIKPTSSGGGTAIQLDRNFSDILVFGRLEISVSAGVSQDSYDLVEKKAGLESLDVDQDLDIDNIYSPQVLKFNCSAKDGARLFDGSSCCLVNFLLKKEFTVNLNDNLIECNNHGLADGDRVSFVSEGVLPANIQKDRVRTLAYFVVNSTFNTFQISLIPDGGDAPVEIIDEGLDSLGNPGGFHYFCPESSQNNLTQEALNQLQVGASYVLDGVNTIVSTNKYGESIIEGEKIIQALYLDAYTYLKYGSAVTSSFYGDITVYDPGALNGEDFIQSDALGTAILRFSSEGSSEFSYLELKNINMNVIPEDSVNANDRMFSIPLHLVGVSSDIHPKVWVQKIDTEVEANDGSKAFVETGSWLIQNKKMLEIIRGRSIGEVFYENIPFDLDSEVTEEFGKFKYKYVFAKISPSDVAINETYIVDNQGDDNLIDFDPITNWSNVLSSADLIRRMCLAFDVSEEEFLSRSGAETVPSFLKESYYMHEVINLLDGSDDLTLQVGSRYEIVSNSISDLQYIHQIENGSRVKLIDGSFEEGKEIDYTLLGASENAVGEEFVWNLDPDDETLKNQVEGYLLLVYRESLNLTRWGAQTGRPGEKFIFSTPGDVNAVNQEYVNIRDYDSVGGNVSVILSKPVQLKDGDSFYTIKGVGGAEGFTLTDEDESLDSFNEKCLRNSYGFAMYYDEDNFLSIDQAPQEIDELKFRVVPQENDSSGNPIVTSQKVNTLTPSRQTSTDQSENSGREGATQSVNKILEIEEVLLLKSGESKQRKPSVALKFSIKSLNLVDLNKNIKIKCRNFSINSSSAAKRINNSMNSSWNTILLDGTIVELLDSSSLYHEIQAARTTGLLELSVDEAGFIDFEVAGFAEYLENNINYENSLQGHRYYKAVSVKEKDDQTFEIIGTEYNFNKFDAIDREHAVRRPFMPIPPQANMDIPESPESIILQDLTYR